MAGARHAARLLRAPHFAATDLGALRDLWRAAWTATYKPRLSGPEWRSLLAILDDPALAAMTPSPPGWIAALDDPFGEGMLASAVARLVCGAGRPTLYVWGCYVRPDHRRRGFGARVVRAALSAAPQEAVADLTVLDGARDAVAFYRALGFQAGEARFVDIGGRSLPGTAMRRAVGELIDPPPAS